MLCCLASELSTSASKCLRPTFLRGKKRKNFSKKNHVISNVEKLLCAWLKTCVAIGIKTLCKITCMVFITGWETWRDSKILLVEVLKLPSSCSLMFSQKLCKQIKGSYSSPSPSTGLYPWPCSISSPEDEDAPSSHTLVTPALQNCPAHPGAATAKARKLKETEPHKSCSSVLSTGTTRALASLCNSRSKPVTGFCSSSRALPCSAILLCEPHWSCSHCCHTETSSFSFSPQMVLITESWDEFIS